MKGLLAPFHVLSPTPCHMRFPPALACLHCYLDQMTFPRARSGTPFSESMSGIALRCRALRSRLGFGPQIRSGAFQLHWCGPRHFNAKWATAHRAHTKGWPLRTLLVLKDNKGNFVFYMCPFLHGWVGHMMECTAVAIWTKAGAWCHDDRSLTLPPSMYSWRCTNIAACRYRGASGESTGSAISRTILSTATWRQPHLVLRNPRRTQQLAANIRWAWKWTSCIGVQEDTALH